MSKHAVTATGAFVGIALGLFGLVVLSQCHLTEPRTVFETPYILDTSTIVITDPPGAEP